MRKIEVSFVVVARGWYSRDPTLVLCTVLSELGDMVFVQCFSGGQRRRVGIGAAFIGGVDVCCLDEVRFFSS